MRFTIITTKAEHQPPQSSCDFLPPGGTIGRGIDNNLVLPDDDRTISRLQAIVHITAAGECRITNRGNVTRVVLNEIPLERGRQVDLQHGDILGIDDYRIEVSELTVQPTATSYPSAVQPYSTPPVIPVPSEGSPTAIPGEIWDSLAQEFSISDNLSSRMKSTVTDSHRNPLTEPEVHNRNPEDPLAQYNHSGPVSVDSRKQTPQTLFSHDELFDRDSIFDDLTPSTLVAPTAEKPQPVTPARSADELDPLALFGGAMPAQINSDDPLGLMMDSAVPLMHPDDLPENARTEMPRVQEAQPGSPLPAEREPHDNREVAGVRQETPLFATAAPLVIDDVPEPVHDVPTAPIAETSSAFNEETVFSPVPPNDIDYGGITLPTPQAVARTHTPPPKGRLRIDPVASNTQSASPELKGEALQGELLQALIAGMGLNDMQPTPHFDRDNMQQLGQMLSLFSQGTVALLSSRSILKRGVKADMTVILDDANNPFKLLPSGKTVLMQMFGSRMPGFMLPKQAVRDALVDLQAHQLGMIAGIRAIIAAMLQSFNPEQLEEEARAEGITSRLSLPGSRKAALWAYFTRRYNETAGEIEDDFHTLFGEAFLHAYDMEVNQYKDSQTSSEE